MTLDEPIVIKGNRGNEALISENDELSIQETLYLLNIRLPSCSYGGIIIMAIGHGMLSYVLLRFGGLGKMNLRYWWPVLLLLWLGPLIIGHNGYHTEIKEFAFNTVQSDDKRRFPAEWKTLDTGQLFPLYVEMITGKKKTVF